MADHGHSPSRTYSASLETFENALLKVIEFVKARQAEGYLFPQECLFDLSDRADVLMTTWQERVKELGSEPSSVEDMLPVRDPDTGSAISVEQLENTQRMYYWTVMSMIMLRQKVSLASFKYNRVLDNAAAASTATSSATTTAASSASYAIGEDYFTAEPSSVGGEDSESDPDEGPEQQQGTDADNGKA